MSFPLAARDGGAVGGPEDFRDYPFTTAKREQCHPTPLFFAGFSAPLKSGFPSAGSRLVLPELFRQA